MRVVLMSATLNASMFSSYLGDCPTLHIPGFMFPVEEHYLEEVLQLTNYDVEQGLRYTESEDRKSSVNIKDDPPVITATIVEQLRQEQKLDDTAVASLRHPKVEAINIDLTAALVASLPIMGLLVHIAMRTPITLDFLCAWIRP